MASSFATPWMGSRQTMITGSSRSPVLSPTTLSGMRRGRRSGGRGGGPGSTPYAAAARRSSQPYMGQGPENVSDVEDLFDETGLPTRLPRNPREAMLFQLQASRAARQQQSRQTAAALSSLRYGLGQVQTQSPYGLGALMSPLLSQMAGVQERVQYAPSDFSLFIRPDPYGEGTGVGSGQAGGSVRNMNVMPRMGAPRLMGPSSLGFQFQPEQQMTRAEPVPSFGLGGFSQPMLMDMDAEPTQPLLSDFRDPEGGFGDAEPL